MVGRVRRRGEQGGVYKYIHDRSAEASVGLVGRPGGVLALENRGVQRY